MMKISSLTGVSSANYAGAKTPVHYKKRSDAQSHRAVEACTEKYRFSGLDLFFMAQRGSINNLSCTDASPLSRIKDRKNYFSFFSVDLCGFPPLLPK